MTPRQKHMWTRRAIRAGWLIAPILAAPMIVNFSVWMYKLEQPATPAQIKEALADNWCMQELMPQRQAQYAHRPMSLQDLKTGTSDCKEAAIRYNIIREQKAALNALGKK